MSSYLQRLLDRAGLAPAAAPALRPALPSRSPIAEADQRLNDPDLAAALLAVPTPATAFDEATPEDFGAPEAPRAAPTARPRRTVARPEAEAPAPASTRPVTARAPIAPPPATPPQTAPPPAPVVTAPPEP
ncbi:hypothetical protein OL599_15865, partial [Rhodovastum sp. RN2-1]|nr:hypothetical protein [Limobrevibacterium gyesilva]